MFKIRPYLILIATAWFAIGASSHPIGAAELDSFAVRRNEIPDENRLLARTLSPRGETITASDSPPSSAELSIARDDQSRTWLIVVNPHPWPILIEIVVKPPHASKTMLASMSDRPLVSSLGAESNLTRQLLLEGSERGAWQLTDETIDIAQWSYRIEPRTMMELESDLARLSQSLSKLTSFQAIEGLLENGDFEVESNTGKLPSNWNASMVPSSKWEVSRESARSGVGSLVFENLRSDTRGWLQSPGISIPSDGRIAAAFWLKLESTKSIPTISASTTLIDTDEDRREWKHTYNPSELNRRIDGWQRIEFPGLTPTSLKVTNSRSIVRFTLDIEGACQLRLDDFTAGRVFLDEAERRELRTNLYVARRELSQNRPKSAWDLSKSEVFRFVVESAPTNSPSSEPASNLTPEARTAEGLLRNSRPETRKPLFDGSRRKAR